jgi:hypothetical protein
MRIGWAGKEKPGPAPLYRYNSTRIRVNNTKYVLGNMNEGTERLETHQGSEDWLETESSSR